MLRKKLFTLNLVYDRMTSTNPIDVTYFPSMQGRKIT